MKTTPPIEKPRRKSVEFRDTKVGKAYDEYHAAKHERDLDSSELKDHIQMRESALKILGELIELRSLVRSTYAYLGYCVPTIRMLDSAIFDIMFALNIYREKIYDRSRKLDQRETEEKSAYDKLCEFAMKGEEQ